VKLGAEEVSDLEASRCRTLVKAGMNGCRASREASSNTVTGRSKRPHSQWIMSTAVLFGGFARTPISQVSHVPCKEFDREKTSSLATSAQ
jgi:hypothetical protein